MAIPYIVGRCVRCVLKECVLTCFKSSMIATDPDYFMLLLCVLASRVLSVCLLIHYTLQLHTFNLSFFAINSQKSLNKSLLEKISKRVIVLDVQCIRNKICERGCLA